MTPAVSEERPHRATSQLQGTAQQHSAVQGLGLGITAYCIGGVVDVSQKRGATVDHGVAAKHAGTGTHHAVVEALLALQQHCACARVREKVSVAFVLIADPNDNAWSVRWRYIRSLYIVARWGCKTEWRDVAVGRV